RGALDAGGLDRHRAVEHLADHQGLGLPLLEATHVEQSGRVHLAGVDVGHPGHRHEDAAPAEHLGDEAEHPRLARLGPDRHHDVAHLADLVALRVEDRQPDQSGRVDADGGVAHVAQRYRRGTPVRRTAGPRRADGVATALSQVGPLILPSMFVTRGTGVHLTVLAFVALGLTACGSDSSSTTATGSDSSSSGMPACTSVWKDGATLPRSYSGCVQGSQVVQPDPLACSSRQRIIRYADSYYA